MQNKTVLHLGILAIAFIGKEENTESQFLIDHSFFFVDDLSDLVDVLASAEPNAELTLTPKQELELYTGLHLYCTVLASKDYPEFVTDYMDETSIARRVLLGSFVGRKSTFVSTRAFMATIEARYTRDNDFATRKNLLLTKFPLDELFQPPKAK